MLVVDIDQLIACRAGSNDRRIGIEYAEMVGDAPYCILREEYRESFSVVGNGNPVWIVRNIAS